MKVKLGNLTVKMNVSCTNFMERNFQIVFKQMDHPIQTSHDMVVFLDRQTVMSL